MSNEKNETIDDILKKYGIKWAEPDDPIYQQGPSISFVRPGRQSTPATPSESPPETPPNKPTEPEVSTRVRLALEEGRRHAESGKPWFVSIGGSGTTPPAEPSTPSPPASSEPSEKSSEGTSSTPGPPSPRRKINRGAVPGPKSARPGDA